MLLQFNFKNFKSFRDDTTLDLTATKITEYSNHIVQIGYEKVLPVAAVYGANASGKSNVYDAFKYMSFYVLLSLSYGDELNLKNISKSEFLKPTPFLFDSSMKNSESSFEVYFIDSEKDGAKTYNYGFTVNQNGVQEEWLNSKSKASKEYRNIFSRNDDELKLPGITSKNRENIKIALEKETLIVSLGAKLKISILKHIRDWFLNNEVADFGNPREDDFLCRQLPKNFVEDINIQKKVVDYIATFDSSIIDFKIDVKSEDENKEKKVQIHAVHKMLDSDETAIIPLRYESAGTQKMFALYPLLQDVMENGSVLFIDELNARLHPLLVRNFVLSFLNSKININNAQLIFTSHDSWQLNANLLRRDEVWFTEKNRMGISDLYSLADFVDEDGLKIRKDENYEKNYLLGKYGAIPTLKNLDVFEEV